MRKILFVSYLFLLIALTIFSYAFVDQNLFYLHKVYSGFAFVHRVITTTLFTVLVTGLFIWYSLLLIYLRKNIFKLQDIRLLIIITVSILLFSYPAMLSYDIFNYIATAKTIFFYHENPYIIMPIEFIKDPLLQFTHAANKTALYGFVWILLSSIPFLSGFGNFLIILFSFKLFTVLFYVATIILLWNMSKSVFTVAYFALNPLVFIELLVSSHNDIVMVFFLLTSFYLLKNKKFSSAVIFFFFSVFIKYATLISAPVFVYALYLSAKRKHVPWNTVYLLTAISMMLAFSSAPFREEIYPWYALWFLPFIYLLKEKTWIVVASVLFSYSLLLRYVPFMLFGTYFGVTPLFKILATFVPISIFGIVYLLKKIFFPVLHKIHK